MTVLLLRDRSLDSVFELIGTNENSLTFAVGWCMVQAPSFLRAIAGVLDRAPPSEQATVSLQEFGGKHGITDIEVRDRHLDWIFEAKTGFLPPGPLQLSKYAARLKQRDDHLAKPLLVVIAQSDKRELRLRASVPIQVAGIPVSVLSWRQIMECCDSSYAAANNTAKFTLRQLRSFIEKVLKMETVESNQVFVVSVSDEFHDVAGETFTDVVEKHGKYFHPVAAGWPASPPNYIGFRWGGRLRSVHHVESYEIITTWRPHFPNATSRTTNPYFLYTLGPAIVPSKTVKTGGLYRSGRVWAAIDLLLTCDTIAEASRQSKIRIVR